MRRNLANKSSGQAAIEYLMIAGFVMTIMLPLVYLVFNYTQESTADITNAQIQKFGRDLVNNAESVYFFSEPSKITLEMNMPQGVRNITIFRNNEASECTKCTEVRFTVQQKSQIADLSFSTNIDIRSENYDEATMISQFPEEAYSPGLKSFKVEAKAEYVLVSMGR
jgi:Flp pilus assembly pilin Flp